MNKAICCTNSAVLDFLPIWKQAISDGNIQQIESLRPRYFELFKTEWLSEDLDEALSLNREDIADYFIQKAEEKKNHKEIVDALDAILYDAACSFNNLNGVRYALSRGASRNAEKIRQYIGMARHAGFHEVATELETVI